MSVDAEDLSGIDGNDEDVVAVHNGDDPPPPVVPALKKKAKGAVRKRED